VIVAVALANYGAGKADPPWTRVDGLGTGNEMGCACDRGRRRSGPGCLDRWVSLEAERTLASVVPSPSPLTGQSLRPVSRILTGGSGNIHRCRYEVNRTVSGEGGERYIPIHTALGTMSLIDRALASIAENVGEGKRWSGRTQSRESRSPEQLQRELHLRGEEGGHTTDPTRSGAVLVRPEV
jgi:hypothetical protein